MDRDVFDRMCAGTLIKVANKLQKSHPNMTWKPSWELELFLAYEAERASIRQQMKLFPDLSGHRIDRHKIAAAMARAILKVRPLLAGGDTSLGARLANEALAIISGVMIVWNFVIQRIRETDPQRVSRYSQHGITFPPTADEKYLTHACKMLYYCNDGGNLMLANLFFLLEACHLRTIDQDGRAILPCEEELT